jgi:hypothetical protein
VKNAVSRWPPLYLSAQVSVMRAHTPTPTLMGLRWIDWGAVPNGVINSTAQRLACAISMFCSVSCAGVMSLLPLPLCSNHPPLTNGIINACVLRARVCGWQCSAKDGSAEHVASFRFLNPKTNPGELIACYISGKVRVWHAPTSAVLGEYSASGSLTAIDVSCDGARFAVGGEALCIDLLSFAGRDGKEGTLGGFVRSAESLQMPESHSNRVQSIRYVPLGAMVTRGCSVWTDHWNFPVYPVRAAGSQ